jgi:hypothetical protein
MAVRFVAPGELQVIIGGVPKLIEMITSGWRPPANIAAVVVRHSETVGIFFLYSARELRESVQEIGGLSARAPTAMLSMSDPTSEPGVVLRDGDIAGAWLLVEDEGPRVEWAPAAPVEERATAAAAEPEPEPAAPAGAGMVGDDGSAPPPAAEPAPAAEPLPKTKPAPASEAASQAAPPRESASPPGAGPVPTPAPRTAPEPRRESWLTRLRRSLRGGDEDRYDRALGSERRGVPATAGVPAAAAPGPARAETGEATIRRTPHLDAPAEITTALGTEFTVAVRTDAGPLRVEEEGTDVVIEAPRDVTRIDVGVVLTVTEHFIVDGDPYRVMRIDRDAPDSEPVIFHVRVADEAPDRNAGIQAVFLYHGRPCGQIGREWDWIAGEPVARAATAAPTAPTSIPVHTEVTEPDLSVVITAPVNDGMHFQCLIETPLLDEYREPKAAEFGLPMKARDYVADMLEDFVDPDKTPAQRREALEVAGYGLFDAAPELFKDVFWALIDAGRRPSSVYIASAEPTLPWELMIPNRPPDRQPSTLRPLGVEFAVGRWTRGDSKSPPQLLPVRDAFVIAPEYEGTRKLDTASEVELVTGKLRGTRVQPATADYLKYYFQTHHASLLHFACHGATDVDDDEAIYLDKDEVLKSGQVRASREFQALCAARAPLVFINACETGQTVPSLGGTGGFPFNFGMIGARAILAPLWPVDDTLAHEVAREIYETALQPDAPPIAEIVRRIRARAYEQLDADTYAAYCFYGDPLAKLELIDH